MALMTECHRRAEVVAIGVAGAFAGDDADSGAHADAFGGAFDDLLVDAEGAGGEVFEVDVGVVAADGGRDRLKLHYTAR